MKKYMYIACGLLIAMSAQSALIVSRLDNVPGSDVTISQEVAEAGKNISARERSLGDLRGAGQSFTWNSTLALDSIGFLVYSGQPAWTDQDYVLKLHELNSSGTVQSTVYTANFTLAVGDVLKNKWVNLDIDNQILTSGTVYGFVLAPKTGVYNGNILYIANNTANPYAGGRATQSALGTDLTTYGSTSLNDLGFYMQTIPEPATMGLLVSAMVGILGIRRLAM